MGVYWHLKQYHSTFGNGGMSWIPGELPADGASISGLASWLPPGCAITLRTLASTACACMCGVIVLCARCSETDEGVTAHGREDPGVAKRFGRSSCFGIEVNLTVAWPPPSCFACSSLSCSQILSFFLAVLSSPIAEQILLH